MTFALAMRNLLRNRRRSLATLAAVAIGAMSVLLFGGYKANIKYSMQTEYVASGGHIQIQHRSFYLYGSGDPTDYGIPGYRGLIDAIQRDDALRGMVVLATPALQFSGVAGNYAAGVSRAVVGWGVVAADYQRMRQWNDFHLTDLQMASALQGTPPDSAVVGVGLARVLRLCETLGITDCTPPERSLRAPAAASVEALPSDIAELGLGEGQGDESAGPGKTKDPRQLELLVSSLRGAPNVAQLSLVAAEKQGFKELDEILLQLHLAQAQQLVYGKAQPEATTIMVQLRHSHQMRAAVIADGVKLVPTPAGAPRELIVDETQAAFTGAWTASTYVKEYWGQGYAHAAPGATVSTARWAVASLVGRYRVYASWTAGTNRARNAGYTVNHGGLGIKNIVNQQVNGGRWVLLGEYAFNGPVEVVLTNQGADGVVIADAVRFVPVP